MQWGPKWGHYSLGPFPAGDLRELVSVCDVKVGSFGKGRARGKGIAWKGGKTMAFFLYVSLLLVQPYLLGSDVGALWSKGIEGSSVSIGREMRNGEALEGVPKICSRVSLSVRYRDWNRME